MNKILPFLTFVFFVLFSLLSQPSSAQGVLEQQPTKDQDTTAVFLFAEVMPTFDGKDGKTTFTQWCLSSLKYPPEAAEQGVQGKVQVSFIIEPDGKLTNAKIIRGSNALLNKEALSVVKRAPALWKPGVNKGKTVRVMYIIPIEFILYQ